VHNIAKFQDNVDNTKEYNAFVALTNDTGTGGADLPDGET